MVTGRSLSMAAMFRRIGVTLLLAALVVAATYGYIKAQRTDAAADPGWNTDAPALRTVTGTPLLSARRVPQWLSSPISGARLTQRLWMLAASPDAPTRTCLVVYRDDEPVYSRYGGDPLAPSALVKIVTAAVILEEAGPLSTYTTEVFVGRNELASVNGGVLTGNIYLVGRGDPVLSTPAYRDRSDDPVAATDFTVLVDRVVERLRTAGVVTVDGSVVADESRFPEQERDYIGELPSLQGRSVWDQSVVNENAAGPLSALLLNDGYVSFSPSADPATNRQNVRAADPALHAAEVFSAMLGQRGVLVSGDPIKGVAPGLATGVSVGSVESPPMSEIVARMLRHNDNTSAEMLFKEIGRRSVGSARAQAQSSVIDVLQRQLGVATEGVAILDGSGLSEHNRLTCSLISDLLLAAGTQSPLIQGMSVAGESGALGSCPAPSTEVEVEVDIEADSDSDTDSDNESKQPIWLQGGAGKGASSLAGATAASNDDVLTFVTISNTEGLVGDLGSCTEFHQQLLDVVAGHPYWRSSAGDLPDPLPPVDLADSAAPSGT